MRKYLSALCFVFAFTILLCACNEADDNGETGESMQTETNENIFNIIVNGTARYGIVRDSNMSDAAVKACSNMFSEIYNATGVRIPIITDDYTLDEGIEEILVGDTSRDESKQLMTTLGTDEFAVKAVGDKIVIAGQNDYALVSAINTFTEMCLDNASDGNWELKRDLSLTGKGNNPAFVNFDGHISCEATLLNTPKINRFDSKEGGNYRFRLVQGGCAIDNYMYTCMLTDETSEIEKCVIVKSDMDTGKVLSYSKEMELGHANDITYNPHENTIVVAVCDGKSLAVLDANTLEFKKKVDLKGSYECAVAYDPNTRTYVTIGAKAEKIYVYNEKFELVKSFSGFMNKEGNAYYDSQGIITDGVYVYILAWHGGESWASGGSTIESQVKSQFVVFNLQTGEYVDTIDLGIKREVEYAIYRDGNFYIGCNKIMWNGLDFYEVEIKSSES